MGGRVGIQEGTVQLPHQVNIGEVLKGLIAVKINGNFFPLASEGSAGRGNVMCFIIIMVEVRNIYTIVTEGEKATTSMNLPSARRAGTLKPN